jgi:hypothetical protein
MRMIDYSISKITELGFGMIEMTGVTMGFILFLDHRYLAALLVGLISC